MGYPMTYSRVVLRNDLRGDYGTEATDNYGGSAKGGIRGDLRRLELDTVDARHLSEYAGASGATTEQVKAIFAQFFGEFLSGPTPK
jgi:hypothetical protein